MVLSNGTVKMIVNTVCCYESVMVKNRFVWSCQFVGACYEGNIELYIAIGHVRL